jgi:nitrogen fixation/metabolism regulation signal transduction histidine kinase
MKLTRFERKILGAIAAVAVVPLLAALVLGRTALREAYEIGVNPRVAEQLANGLAVYRAHLTTLRDDAERTADAVAFDYRLRDAALEGDPASVERVLEQDLARYSHVARIVVRDVTGASIAEASVAERLDEEELRHLTQIRELPDIGEVQVTIGTPAAPFREYQRAGEVHEVYARLEQGSELVSGFFVAGYIGLLLAVIVIAMAVGIVLSRRVTRRVADLAEATERVGAGDLFVEVPTDAKDEIGELTRAFNDMVRDLRESRDRIDYLQRIGAWQELARRLAHEIKNPLTPIQLAAQELHTAYRGTDDTYRRKLEDARAIIEEEVATLRRLVGEFSSFAKLPRVELAAADLGDFLSDVERSLAAIPEGEAHLVEDDLADVDVRTERPSEPLPVRIDAMMLKRCVDNLVRNGVQAVRRSHPEGGGLVVVSARRIGDEAILEVRDDGPGVPAETRQRVFDPYYTTRAEGTGLGLAIVKKVVLEHGGEIDCAEAAEGGAAFRIHLPLDESRGEKRAGRAA